MKGYNTARLTLGIFRCNSTQLASRRELEKLIRAGSGGTPIPERFLGWRKGVVTERLLEIVA